MIFRLNEPFVIPAFLYSTKWTLDSLTRLSDLLFILLNANKSEWFVMCFDGPIKVSVGKIEKKLSTEKNILFKIITGRSWNVILDIWLRRSSEAATAKVRLSGHTLEDDPGMDLTLKLVKNNRVTIYLKVSWKSFQIL